MHPSFSLFPGLRRAAGTLACLALLCTATAPAAAPVPDSSPRMTPVVTRYSLGMSLSLPLYHSVKVFLLL